MALLAPAAALPSDLEAFRQTLVESLKQTGTIDSLKVSVVLCAPSALIVYHRPCRPTSTLALPVLPCVLRAQTQVRSRLVHEIKRQGRLVPAGGSARQIPASLRQRAVDSLVLAE